MTTDLRRINLTGILPRTGRTVFLDTETTGVDRWNRKVWEVGAIVRDPGQPDREYEWQIRPDLAGAEPTGLRIGQYYRRCQIAGDPVGAAKTIVHPDLHPNVDYPHVELLTTAAHVALQVALMVDAATVVGAVPGFDEHSLALFLAEHNHAWTANYRLVDVESVAFGYLHGRARYSEQVADQLTEALGRKWHTDAGPDPLPLNHEALSKGVFVPLPVDAHRALVDARHVRDMLDAMTGYEQPVTAG